MSPLAAAQRLYPLPRLHGADLARRRRQGCALAQDPPRGHVRCRVCVMTGHRHDDDFPGVPAAASVSLQFCECGVLTVSMHDKAGACITFAALDRAEVIRMVQSFVQPAGPEAVH
jgi:hypothetical protein